MFLRSYTKGLIPAAAILLGFALGKTKANAQTNYEFTADYDTVVRIDPSFRPDIGITRVTVTGENPNAPFGLTNFISNTYGRFDPTTNISTFDANPAVFGLEGVPILADRYFGGSNEIFGTASDQAKFDFAAGTVQGSGTITLTGGKGIFENASGKITFTQNDRLTSTDVTEPFRGKATLNFSVKTPQAVPEPRTKAVLMGLGILGLGVRSRRHRKQSEEIMNYKL